MIFTSRLALVGFLGALSLSWREKREMMCIYKAYFAMAKGICRALEYAQGKEFWRLIILGVSCGIERGCRRGDDTRMLRETRLLFCERTLASITIKLTRGRS